jgi:hypothetical protein
MFNGIAVNVQLQHHLSSIAGRLLLIKTKKRAYFMRHPDFMRNFAQEEAKQNRSASL